MKIITVTVILAALTEISYIDFKTKAIPGEWNAALFILGIWSSFAFAEPSFSNRLAGVFVVSVPMFFTALLLPGALGCEDVKLMAAGGMVLGTRGCLTAVFLGMAAAGVYRAVSLFSRKTGKTDAFALGSFLCAGIGIALLSQF